MRKTCFFFHFLRFPFSGDHISKFLKGEEEIKISITHPNYNYSNILEKESRLALAKDFVAN